MKTIRLQDKLNEVDFEYENLREPIPQILDFTDGKILSPFRSDSVKALWSLKDLGFTMLAWTPNVRYMLYNSDDNILIQDTEGDIDITFNPTRKYLNERLQNYPKGEVSTGEKYDSRFKRT